MSAESQFSLVEPCTSYLGHWLFESLIQEDAMWLEFRETTCTHPSYLQGELQDRERWNKEIISPADINF